MAVVKKQMRSLTSCSPTRLIDCSPISTIFNDNQDPYLRSAAMHTVALAYAGTNDNKAIRRFV